MRPPPTLTEEAAAGAAAGVAGTVLGFPLDTVKARLQCGRNSGAWQCVREVATREGVRGFYRGVASPLFSMTLLNTLCFQSYSLTRQLVALPPVPPPSDRRGAEGALWRRFAAGALIAPLVTVVSTPFELVKVQLQLDAKPSSGGGARQFTGAWHAARCIAEQRGVRALWLGAPVNLVREALFLGVYFSCYESFKGALFTRVDGISPSAAVPVAGGLSGACAWFVSFPLDSVKNNVQAQPVALIASPQQLRTRDVAATVWNTTGVRGLFRGVLPSVLRAFLVSGSRFSAYEAALELMRGAAH